VFSDFANEEVRAIHTFLLVRRHLLLRLHEASSVADRDGRALGAQFNQRGIS